ncbi:NADP-dependent oxidoreductase [Oleiagrimonas sp. C23AA]|uniref:NADP-dependent oxidoreductase n=1 Tax=Oleiagrimonas sp. C23AA TaxID=2719047 RepID=UPI00142009A6|nr:NADP-dependent oxidoreductase [Oleiagrimonas sp. C23AA]NII09522.1 NADP-dependent oxidoreductase [Oleiagrimonas sp. C23AA]
MKLVRIHRFGDSSALVTDQVPTPSPEPDEVVIHIQAAGINPVDFKIREGDYPPVVASQLPVGMGRDVAGVISKVGARVEGLQKGDAVYAMAATGRGTYGDYVAVRASEVAAMPSTLDAVQAAAVPLAALTAWQGLFDHGHVAQGKRVLIHGASGGVGHFAVQFARGAGAQVLTTARAEDAPFLEALGADQVIDYRHEDFSAQLGDVDVVFDLIGGETQQRSFEVLKPGGMLVSTLGEPSQDEAHRRHMRATRYTVQPNAAQLQRIGRMIDAKEVSVTVHESLPLKQAARAQDVLQCEHIRGKLVLKMAA